MVCLVDPWPNTSCLTQKYQLASKTSICTDLTTADVIDIKELFTAKQSLEVIKVITSYENDLTNLEPIWDLEYNQQQWLISTFSRLSIADHVVFLQPVALTCLQTGPAVIFTPGRSGTHVLKGITGINNQLHHDDNLLITDKFLKLINAERVLSVLRKRFVDQVISDAIGNLYGVMVTTSANLEQHQQAVLTWKPFDLCDSDYKHTLEKICSYVDLLLGIRMLYHKQIEFSLLEDLHEHFDKIPYVKNPYKSQNIISNYSEAVDYCNREYQPIYNQLLNKIQSVLGTTLHHHD